MTARKGTLGTDGGYRMTIESSAYEWLCVWKQGKEENSTPLSGMHPLPQDISSRPRSAEPCRNLLTPTCVKLSTAECRPYNPPLKPILPLSQALVGLLLILWQGVPAYVTGESDAPRCPAVPTAHTHTGD